MAAAREGDLRRLERLLTRGRGLARTAAAATVLVPCEVNGGPALLALADGGLPGVVTLEVAEGRIAALRICVGPDKIAYAARQFAASAPS
ncbi:hypothetical protein [Streptomyces sp. WMMB303]|uniref:hypothetical protein n=1 Tax=Streptomyces sp. WMMB303 TaxID=3034154 RepID=UPI0023EB4A39|nr:hypothetical protein [Streptomyces sp. WMMB303]MDF4251554.1 hypothetical protein [Streptomyces sp. WMMB303]